MEILESEQPDAFKIPMSISECYDVKDKSGNKATACDIAINNKFFAKIQQSPLFSNFLTALMFEAVDDKYKIKCVEDSWTVLKHLKAMTNGSLKSHRIENRDNDQVKQYYKGGLEAEEDQNKPKSLIQVIDENDAQQLRKRVETKKQMPQKYVPDPTKVKVSEANYKKPNYRLVKTKGEGDEVVLVGEFHLPDVVSFCFGQ